MNPQLLRVRSLKSLGKGSFGAVVKEFYKSLCKGLFGGRDQRLLQIIRLNTLVDVIRVPKVRTSGE